MIPATSMRLNGFKGSSSRVFLAILYTSILWFTLDVLILAMYSSLSEDSNGSTHKLPTNAEPQRNARNEEPAYALSGEAALDTHLRHDIVRDGLNKPAEANRKLAARGGRGRRKPSRFSWGNNLDNKLLHSNKSKEHLQLSNEKIVDELVDDKRLSKVGGEMKKEIEMLKKELDKVRGNNEKIVLQGQDDKLSRNDIKSSDTRPRLDRGSIDDVPKFQKEKEEAEKGDNPGEKKNDRVSKIMFGL